MVKREFWSVVERGLFACSFLSVLYALYLVFMCVPNERVMGPVQKIFYFHVGSAMACYGAIGLLLVGSLGYLATRQRNYDVLSEAAAEVALVFCTVVLISGMIWGHSAWNTWFRFDLAEPRLLSFLLLWLMLLSINLLRRFADPTRIERHCAVLGIVSAVTVPIVMYSIKLLPQAAQLHPQIIERRGLKDPLFIHAWAATSLALILLQASLVWLRVRIGCLARGMV